MVHCGDEAVEILYVVLQKKVKNCTIDLELRICSINTFDYATNLVII